MPKKVKAKLTTPNLPTIPALKREITTDSRFPVPPALKRVAIDRRADKYKRRGK